MLEYVKTLFPELVEKVKTTKVITRIGILLLILFVLFIWNYRENVHKILLKEISITGYFVLLFILILVFIYISFTLFIHKVKSRYLKQFVIEWLSFKKEFDWLYTLVEVWLFRGDKKNDSDDLKKLQDIGAQAEVYYRSRDILRELLFRIGEEHLIVYDNKHWSQIKNKAAIFKDRDYKTPFSFLLDLGAPIAEINLNGEAIKWSLATSEEYIEHLSYKYKYIKKIVNNHTPNPRLSPTASSKRSK
jgi:hypothetical protein